MTLKTWVLGRVHRGGALFTRTDLPPREPPTAVRAGHGASAPQRPHDGALGGTAAGAVGGAPHLGLYAALIGAVRGELEQFMAHHVRLHLAIADHDRFVLTSIHVGCTGDAEARRLLQQFMHEFKPEQVKRFLAREVIAALPNAAAIDLTQFAGLLDADAHAPADAEDNDYSDLLAALRGADDAPGSGAYQVSISGRWSERDGAAAAGATGVATPATPLAGQRCDFDVDDAEGRRRIVLHGVMAGRRYVIGKDAGCDIRVNGTYTSRRHGELWLDDGAWHVSDAGSTNGIRVESPGGAVKRSAPRPGEPRGTTIRLAGGERIVLSAHADGAARDYPSVALRSAGADRSARTTPIAGAMSAKTPLTPIRSGRQASEQRFVVRSGSGARSVALTPDVLPVSVGRSRNQTLVIERAHELVSGHHLDIVGVDEDGAQVVVHGDNGVIVDGVPHAAGARFVWRPGQAMVLGIVPSGARPCTLTLTSAD